MRTTILIVWALLAAPSLAFAQDPAQDIVRYQLENGLDVVLAPDRHVPKVVTNLVYRVGALNEPKGRSGFAHLFEHLMFSGTDAWPSLFGAMGSLGGYANAWTSEDRTLYYLEGVSSILPVLLSLEADRMANLGASVDQRELDLQRSVVKNEMRQTVIDQAGSTGWEVIWSALFAKPHPYSKTVLGSLADLDAASLDDVRGFFNTYYVPNNAILAVVGDFDVDDAKSMIEQTFGKVARGADVSRPAPSKSEPTRVRLEFSDQIPNPDVGIVFAGPAFSDTANGPLAIAAELLGNGEYGVLRNRLVAKGLAAYAAAEWVPGYLAGRFYVDAGAVDGVDEAAIEKALRGAFAEFAGNPIDSADVERAKRVLLQAARVGREPFKDRAGDIAVLTDMLDDPSLAFKDDPYIANATAADVEAAVKQYLAIGDASVMVIKPGPRGDFPPLFTASTGDGAPFTTPERPKTEIPKLEKRDLELGRLPEMQTARLSNGIEVIHYRMPEAPMAYIAADARGGWLSAPAGKEGLFTLASNMAWRGAGERDYAAFAKAAKDIGADLNSKAWYQSTEVTLSVPPEALDEGVALLADAVLKPRFDKAEWDINVTETLDYLGRREADLPDVADRAANGILMPRQPDRAYFDWSYEAVNAISLDDAKQAYARLFTPSGVKFISIGPMPVSDVAASLEKAFGNWANDGRSVEAVGHQSPAFPEKERIVLLPEPGASQTAIVIIRPAPGITEPKRPESIAVMRLLGSDFTGRLNSVIREEKGYSYGVYGNMLDENPVGSGLVTKTTVERDNTGPALAEFFTGFDSLTTKPVTQGELDRTVTAYQQRIAGLAETSGGLFEDVTSLAGENRDLAGYYAKLRELTGLKLEPVQVQALALASLDHALIVLVGDADVIKPQLDAIGLTDVEIMERPQASREIARSDATAEAVHPDGTTRTIHDCGDDSGLCGALSHPQ